LAFDLSRVLFITTANSLDSIPQPLLDRMEILRLSGYSEEEKQQIARRYLIPKQLKATALTDELIEFTDEGLQAIIRGYTREAGLRRLERAIARVTRKVTLLFAEGQTEKALITPDSLGDLLGPEMFLPEQMRKTVPAGVVTGLAWTETGGDVLYIESTLLPNGKGLTLTGQLGEVMQESAKIAQSYIWAHAADLGVDPESIKDNGVHVHVPAGAIPKDGPSAGVTMTSAMASLYTGLPARSDVAMTGEVTLAGLVLPIGGVKEKVLAARRAGIHRVVLPMGNKKDLRDLPDHVRQEMQFHFVERVEDVLSLVIPGLQVKPLAMAS
jgi:ATP-dependent Lon protease